MFPEGKKHVFIYFYVCHPQLPTVLTQWTWNKRWSTGQLIGQKSCKHSSVSIGIRSCTGFLIFFLCPSRPLYVPFLSFSPIYSICPTSLCFAFHSPYLSFLDNSVLKQIAGDSIVGKHTLVVGRQGQRRVSQWLQVRHQEGWEGVHMGEQTDMCLGTHAERVMVTVARA